MNWATLKKEQKQAVVLVAMWVLGGVFAVYQFVLVPFLRDRGKSVGELEELQVQIQKAEVAMDGQSKVRAEYAEATKHLQEATEKYIVPLENPLSWVTEKVYMHTRRVGVDVQSVAEISGTAPLWKQLTKRQRFFRPYAVRITTFCSYAQLIQIVRSLEESNPFLCVSEINVAGAGHSPMQHSVNVVVEWPMWGREVKIGVLKTRSGSPAGSAAVDADGEKRAI